MNKIIRKNKYYSKNINRLIDDNTFFDILDLFILFFFGIQI